jgi:asparagine synthase (glutamine-hydrolysing)
VTVALAGTGGDEMFAGYPRYRGMRLHRRWHGLPLPLRRGAAALGRAVIREAPDGDPARQRVRRFLAAGALPYPEAYVSIISAVELETKRSLYTEGFRESVGSADTGAFLRPLLEGPDSLPPNERLMAADLATYLPFNQLASADRMSMSRSLEVRVPFVDQRVVEVAGRIPLALKMTGGVTKGILRKALGGFLPPEIVSAPKTGLNLPLPLWFRRELKDWVAGMLSDDTLKLRGHLKPEGVRALMAEHQSGRRDHSLFLWALVVLEEWHRQYTDGRG